MERFLSLQQEENTIGIITGGDSSSSSSSSTHSYSQLRESVFLPWRETGELTVKTQVSARPEVLSESLTLTLQPERSESEWLWNCRVKACHTICRNAALCNSDSKVTIPHQMVTWLGRRNQICPANEKRQKSPEEVIVLCLQRSLLLGKDGIFFLLWTVLV